MRTKLSPHRRPKGVSFVVFSHKTTPSILDFVPEITLDDQQTIDTLKTIFRKPQRNAFTRKTSNRNLTQLFNDISSRSAEMATLETSKALTVAINDASNPVALEIVFTKNTTQKKDSFSACITTFANTPQTPPYISNMLNALLLEDTFWQTHKKACLAAFLTCGIAFSWAVCTTPRRIQDNTLPLSTPIIENDKNPTVQPEELLQTPPLEEKEATGRANQTQSLPPLPSTEAAWIEKRFAQILTTIVEILPDSPIWEYRVRNNYLHEIDEVLKNIRDINVTQKEAKVFLSLTSQAESFMPWLVNALHTQDNPWIVILIQDSPLKMPCLNCHTLLSASPRRPASNSIPHICIEMNYQQNAHYSSTSLELKKLPKETQDTFYALEAALDKFQPEQRKLFTQAP